MNHETLFPRAGGVLLHPTSLPSRYGIGDVGAGARAFVDWLQSAGLSRWQVLPLVPPGPGASPYSSPSAFAGNPWLIDLDQLVEDGLLAQSDVADVPTFSLDAVEFDRVFTWKRPLLDRAAHKLVDDKKHPLHEKFRAFRESESWALDYGIFVALKEQHQGKAWWDWERDLAFHEPKALAAARKELHTRVDNVVAEQFLFEEGWQKLRRYAHQRGVKLIGDIPIYVDSDSADVWSHRRSFMLKADGRPEAVAGVPPDAFTELGQLWGNPLYDWDALAADGHAFWVERLRRVIALTDIVRIDHFRAFSAYWRIPADAPDARTGTWMRGPGLAVFKDLERALGPLPVIVEDLGQIDDDVHALREAIDLPGMKVLQFAFGEDGTHQYLPHNYPENCVVYAGTHDNDTILGWWHTQPEHVRDHVRRYLNVSGHDVVWDMMRAAFASVAHTAIVTMQDVLALDGSARMNTPGQAHGNWGWRARPDAFGAHAAERLRGIARLFNRDEADRARILHGRQIQKLVVG
jgi:4-alpha-glucanotransferase